MEKAFKAMGYKTQVQTLSHFHDDYGLEGGESDGEGENDDDDDEEGTSDEEGGVDGQDDSE